MLSSRPPAGKIGCLVISPSRELASQIAAEAEKLLKFHSNFTVKVFFGETNMKRDVISKSEGHHILVATPGRLIAHFENTPGFKNAFSNVRVVLVSLKHDMYSTCSLIV